VVADARKFGRRSLSLIGSIACARRVITDSRLGKEMADVLREKGLELIIV
jgi:DeoR/GlpR family transcriptional regulator of sugar metabolism